MSRFGPHDLPRARRAAVLIAFPAATILLLFTAATAGDGLRLEGLVGGLVVLACAVVVWRGGESVAGAMCLVAPLLGVVVITVLDVVTNDSTVAAQVFFTLPVLFAATQLRGAGAVAVLIAAVVGETVVCFALLGTVEAITDAVHVAAVLVLVTVVLVRAHHQQQRLVVKLRQQAAIDPLTGLVTRRVLDEAAGSALMSSSDSAGTALLLVDLDHFKRVNDTYGHPVGDDALELVGRVLRSCSHAGDVVARMGGDELGLLLTACPFDAAVRRADSVVAQVADAPLLLADGRQVPLSVSVGVAHAPDHASDVRHLYTAADQALYEAKRAGRGRVGRAPVLASRP